MARLLIEDVTLSKDKQTHHPGPVQGRGGTDVDFAAASAVLDDLADDPRSDRRG